MARLTLYGVSEEKKEEVEERARQDPDVESVSGYLKKLVDRQLLAESEDRIATEALAEERLRSIVQEGKEEMGYIARQMARTEHKRSTYEIVTFLILKEGLDIPEQTVNDYFEAAHKRLEAGNLTEPPAASGDDD